tara:strand:- start:1138 stop:1374 length:237 start_codon:yes stop_codon:yes gene_type:complete
MTWLKQQYKGLKQHDLFGHVIQMNFNKKGPQHKTTFGGIVSITIKIFIRVYVILTLKSLLFLEENTNTTVESLEPEVP